MFKIETAQAASFLVACEEGSIRSASERLDVEPSTISRQIKALEASLRIVLIERGRKGVRPTEAGNILLTYLKRQQSEQETLLSEFDELIGMRRGELVVAVGDGFISDFIGNALRRTRQYFRGFHMICCVARRIKSFMRCVPTVRMLALPTTLGGSGPSELRRKSNSRLRSWLAQARNGQILSNPSKWISWSLCHVRC